MAWQLIYTSAPRLLEAGRSGFGTVARHRSIPNLLVGAIERISQFSRLPGLAEDRIIYSHRHISISGVRFHVISRISDAGADYTGRTNHIAHHLIFDPKEIGTSLVTPADVLLFFGWKTGWNETPRYLDSTEEVSLDSIPQRVRLPANCWGRAAGNKRYAALLVGSEVSRGCCLLYVDDPNSDPAQQFGVYLFGESLLLTGGRTWSFPFTTNLQPSDDAADFLWSGVWANSPVRNQIEQRERTIFSLEPGGVMKNGSSNQVLVPIGAAADLAETGKSAVFEPPQEPATVPAARFESTIPEQPFIPMVSEPRRAITPRPVLAGYKVEKQQYFVPQERRRKLWIPIAAVAGIVCVLFSVFGYFHIAKWLQTREKQRNAVLDSLSEVPGHTDSDADELIKEMGEYNQGEVDSIRSLGHNWRNALATSAGNSCEEIRQDCLSLQGIEKPESVRSLVARVMGWLDLRSKVLSDPVTDETSYDEYASLCAKIKTQDTDLSSNNVSDALLQCNAKRRCVFLIEELNQTMRPTHLVAWFQEKLDAIKKDIPQNPLSVPNSELSQNVDQLSKIVALWDALEKSKLARQATDDLKKRSNNYEGFSPPAWLVKGVEDFNAPPPVAAAPTPIVERQNTTKQSENAGNIDTAPLTVEDKAKNGSTLLCIVLGDEGLSQLTLPFEPTNLTKLSLVKGDTRVSLGQGAIPNYFVSGKMCFHASKGGKLMHTPSLGGAQELHPTPPFLLEGTIPSSNTEFQPNTEFQIRVLGSDTGNDKNTNPLNFAGGLIIVEHEHDHKHQIILDKAFEKLRTNLILPPDVQLKLPPRFDPYAQDDLQKTVPFQDYGAEMQFVDELVDDSEARKRKLESELEKTSPAVAASNDPFENFPSKSSQTSLSVKDRANSISDYLKDLPFKDSRYKNKVLNDSKVKGLVGVSDWTAMYNQLRQIQEILQSAPDPSNKNTEEDEKMMEAEYNKWIPILADCRNRIAALATATANASNQIKIKAALDNLKTMPLLGGKLPGGTYSVIVTGDDGRSEVTLVEFQISRPTGF